MTKWRVVARVFSYGAIFLTGKLVGELDPQDAWSTAIVIVVFVLIALTADFLANSKTKAASDAQN